MKDVLKILIISKRFKNIAEENTSYAWSIKLTRILIDLIPLNPEDKLDIFERIQDHLVDENIPFLLESKKLKFGNTLCINYWRI